MPINMLKLAIWVDIFILFKIFLRVIHWLGKFNIFPNHFMKINFHELVHSFTIGVNSTNAIINITKKKSCKVFSTHKQAVRNMLWNFQRDVIINWIINDNFTDAVSFLSHMIIDLATKEEEKFIHMENSLEPVSSFQFSWITWFMIFAKYNLPLAAVTWIFFSR